MTKSSGSIETCDSLYVETWAQNFLETQRAGPQPAFIETAFADTQHCISDLFDQSYRQQCTPMEAVTDIHLVDQLLQQFDSHKAYNSQQGSNEAAVGSTSAVATQLTLVERAGSIADQQEHSVSTWSFRIVHAKTPIPLSDILPLLEDFGFRVIGENRQKLAGEQWFGDDFFLHAFELELLSAQDNSAEKAEYAAIFESAFQRVWDGRVQSDKFNQLLFHVGIGWRHINMLRAYASYMKQICLPFTQSSIADALAAYPTITNLLVDFFDQRFEPTSAVSVEQRSETLETITSEIWQALDGVEHLNDDKMIRQYLQLMRATLRTNFYLQSDIAIGEHCLAFKFDCPLIDELPKPKPRYEIYVFDKRVQGVHLRGGKVARGGLRWSDRDADFRTEVLGLVKAQQVKNAVIVPMGAKGGFICSREPANSSREAFIENGQYCYRLFINSLLSVTDNLLDGKVISPESTVCWDDQDPYFVVAADKGTATFSDIANDISSRRGFWLGDAFASGGSIGYDHKAMGITARGAWVAVQRHFRELNIDVQKEPFTAVAVGDMAGDVFGNGMLCSDQIKLKAAFNHAHIFLDPKPDPTSSFKERQRLFDEVSGWDAYDQSLISAGGGIFSRKAKSIQLSPEVKSWLQIEVDALSPNELIKAILHAEVDLLWNGGIGTYIKAASESHSDVGDRANNELRVDGASLGARVFGEGGNLGATQLGRVEFCLNGGRCNTDFIDNAGGVDCSDHEVNIKILLDELVESSVITSDERNTLFLDMTDEVASLVLHNNYRQTQAISMIEQEARLRALEYQRLLSDFERRGIIDRAIEFMPSDEELHERKLQGQSLTRPEISVLVSYAKLSIKSELLQSDVFDDALIAKLAEQAFPERLRGSYDNIIGRHRLNKEIIATQLASGIVDFMGVAFVQRMQEATGESVCTIAKAYMATIKLFDIDQRWSEIEALDGIVSSQEQYKMFAHIVRLVRRSTRWLLRRCRSTIEPMESVSRYVETGEFITAEAANLLRGEQLDRYLGERERYADLGVPGKLANFIAASRHIYNAFALQRTIEETGFDRTRVCTAYFELGEALKLNWFSDQIVSMSVENYWQALARESFRDELESQHATLTANLLAFSATGDISKWSEDFNSYIDRWSTMMNEIVASQDMDIAMYPVALRELLDLAQASEPKRLRSA